MADTFQSALARLQRVPPSCKTSSWEQLTSICLHLLESQSAAAANLADISVLESRIALSNVESDPLVPFRAIPAEAARPQAALEIFGYVQRGRLQSVTARSCEPPAPSQQLKGAHGRDGE